jgi:hypothetical protein
VRREGGQALPDVLLVADVGAHGVEQVDACPRRDGDVQAGTGEEHRQCNALEDDRLAPGVGSRDHEHVEALAEADVVGDRIVAGDERVAQLGHAQHAVGLHHRLGGLHLLGESGARVREVDRLERLQARIDRVARGRRLLRQVPQHPQGLALDLEFRLLQAVVQLDQGLRFDEERRSRLRGVVDDAAYTPSRVGADREHVAVVADRVVGVGEVRGDAGIPQYALEASLDLRREAAHLAPRRGQGRGGGIA